MTDDKVFDTTKASEQHVTDKLNFLQHCLDAELLTKADYTTFASDSAFLNGDSRYRAIKSFQRDVVPINVSGTREVVYDNIATGLARLDPRLAGMEMSSREVENDSPPGPRGEDGPDIELTVTLGEQFVKGPYRISSREATERAGEFVMNTAIINNLDILYSVVDTSRKIHLFSTNYDEARDDKEEMLFLLLTSEEAQFIAGESYHEFLIPNR